MRFGTLLLSAIVFSAASAGAQEIQLYGELGSELHVTPPNTVSSLNPGNVLNIDRSTDSSDVTLIGEVSASDKRWALQTKLRGSHEWRTNPSAALQIDELSFKYGVASWMDLRVGRKIQKWGTGYAWNPTGVVNPRKDPADPGDRRSAFRGVDMVAADLFVKGWDITLVGAPEIAWPGGQARTFRSIGWAARGYRVSKGTDIAITASGGSGLPNSQGLSLARVFGDALELHGEVAYISDEMRYVPRDNALVLQQRPHGEVLVGGQYTFKNNVNVIAEFYHAGQGLSGREWRDFRDYAGTAADHLAKGDPARLVLANARFRPLGMGKNYAFFRGLVPLRGERLQLETVVISSLRDGSSLVRPGLLWKVTPNWRLYVLQTEFIGHPRTELGHIQLRRSTDIGVRYHFSLHDRAARPN
jgi:hypothetical protein